MAKVDTQVMTLLNKSLPDYKEKQIEAVLDLLEEGNTVPFIARYRKEATDSLDEVEIREIEERYNYISNLEKRKSEVISNIDEQGELTSELEQEIQQADQLQQVEDLYLPYKKKRRTKAQIAREQDLTPLADWLREFSSGDVEEKAAEFIDKEQEVATAEDALDGAHEIIAEDVGDSAKYRTRVRQIMKYIGKISSTLKRNADDPKEVYELYYDFSEPVKSVTNHQILAMNRGEKENVLTVKIEADDKQPLQYILAQEIPRDVESPAKPYVTEAVEDGYKRFIKPAIEREIRNHLTERAEEHAIEVFGDNLQSLLLQPPLKDQTIMGFDPAFRTGCKLAIVDGTGKVLAIDVIYPHKPASAAQRKAAKPEFIELIQKYDVDTVAIGNGTASRESERFVAEAIQEIEEEVAYVIVNESGASVYSASQEARDEFPDLAVEERSAVSIARRLQDPLAELVKIDPQSIGVGQYQHDVSQKELTDQLDFVIEMVVNRVGVNINTASAALLRHISGLTKTTAENVVNYRNEHGIYEDRSQLKEVPRIGPKAFEQSVGFLRIPNGENPLDRTGIHPETYEEAYQILETAGVALEEIGSEQAREALKGLDDREVRKSLDIGKETYQSIIEALVAPGRDMRDEFDAPILKTEVLSMEDLKPGMELEGAVRNVVDFGAFVDVGVEQDGLVHISKMSQSFVDHPSDVVQVGDNVTVWVEDVDEKRERISLTMIPQ